MASNDWSPFYPTVIYPAQESTALQRQMTSDLQTIVRKLSSAENRQNEPKTVVVQESEKSLSLAAELAGQMRDALHDGFDRTNSNLESLSSCLEWNIGLLHEGISAQTSILQEITQQQRIPTELQASEHFTNGQNLATQWIESIQTNRLDETQASGLHRAIDERYQKALDLIPGGKLMYTILLGRAELNILAQKYKQAVADLEESLIYAPKEGSLDYISYSCRLLGRIAFTQQDVPKAISYLTRAVERSPDYAIAGYDLAQYLAQLPGETGAQAALQHLRQAIEREPDFLVLTKLESNFDPIRQEVEELVRRIIEEAATDLHERTEGLRQTYLTVCALNRFKVQRIRDIFYNRNFKNKERLATELAGKMGSDQPFTVNYFDGKVPSISSLQDRVKACTSLESLRALNGEVMNLGKTCDELLQQLDQLEALLNDLPAYAERWLKGWKEMGEEYNAKIRVLKNRLKHRYSPILGIKNYNDYEALHNPGRLQEECDRCQRSADYNLELAREISALISELQAVLASPP